MVSEIHAQQILHQCPGGIVKMHEIFADESFVYLIMDLMLGVTLKDLMGYHPSL